MATLQAVNKFYKSDPKLLLRLLGVLAAAGDKKTPQFYQLENTCL